jgi:hypothetical protein
MNPLEKFATYILPFAFLMPVTSAATTPGNEDGLFVVEDAQAQFEALKHHAEALGWRNPESDGAPDPGSTDHYQGLVRNPNPGTPVFYITQKDNDDQGRKGGYLLVIELKSRDTSGERLRSNLQEDGQDTEDTSPNENDTWVSSIRFDGTLENAPVFDGIRLPAYEHPGGMALVDDVLFVPVDTPASEADPVGQLLLFDVSADPLIPIPLQAFELEHAIDNVAVTRLDNGRYRIWTNGDGGADIRVYDTTSTDLRDDTLDLTLRQEWDPATDLVHDGFGCLFPPELVELCWPRGASAHQSSTFLRDTDGKLYMITMRHPGGFAFSGEDWASLYLVEEQAPGELRLTWLAQRMFHCRYDGGGGPQPMRVCNMGAGNNAYVSLSGELILYSVPHDDEDGFDIDIVRMGEFRHRDVNRENSPLRLPTADAAGPYQVNEGGVVELSGTGGPPADRPWVELYDDDGYLDRSIVVDYDDRDLLELENFNDLDNFNDKTTSVRWRAPVGLNIELYDDDNFQDRTIRLFGTGETQAIDNLGTQVVVAGLVEQDNPSKGVGEELEFNDKTSSLKWVEVAPPASVSPTLEWDLDGDSVFGETGAAALRGDEVGSFPNFDAAGLDGPIDLSVSLRAIVTNATGVGDIGEDAAIIHVLNVPPTVAVDSLNGGLLGIGLIGLPVTLNGHFSDVPEDSHTAEVNWDDGVTKSAGVDAGDSTVTATHVYDIAGTFDVELAVTDDDLGRGTASALLIVYDPRGAVEDVLDQIDMLLGTPLDPKDLAALEKGRDRLDGQNSGRAKNGALDKLGSGDLIPALVKLEATIQDLDKVVGIDVAALKLQLALAANSIARATRDNAADTIGPVPTPEQQAKLDDVDAWLADGEVKLRALDYDAAVRSFRFSTARALELL